MLARPSLRSATASRDFGLRAFHVSTCNSAKQHFKLVVAGGGSGGCAISHVFSRKLGKDKVAVVDPADSHYYQPLFTLVGGGIRKLEDTRQSMGKSLPADATWIRERVVSFDPKNNAVRLSDGSEVTYDYLVVALGIQLRFDLIKGLPDAFNHPKSGVCSNYSPDTVHLTWKALQHFRTGNALFTFPNTPIKCAGAPQKIMYIADHYFRRQNKRADVNIIYNTALPVIFGVEKYAATLNGICAKRGISVNLRHVLVEVKADTKEAVFAIFDKDNKQTGTKTLQYEMLHVGAPCAAPDVLKQSELGDAAGFLDVSKETLQHARYPNIFGIGDCTSCPTAKTGAAVAAQVGVLRKNLGAVMESKKPSAVYDGYTSCPLVTSYNTCVMAEFTGYTGQPLETFPINQAKERYTMFPVKSMVIPALYWHGLIKGYWEGPGFLRKLLHFGTGK